MEQFIRHRHKASFPVVIDTPQGKHRLKIVDVNDEGARLKGSLPQGVGETLMIPIPFMNLCARIQWVGEGFLGVMFTPALTNCQLETIRFGAKQVPGLRFNSTGLQELG